MAEAAPMNGGQGIYSYANNSLLQRDGFTSTKNLIKDVIIQNLDVKTIVSSSSNKFTIVDLGCSVGPNTFFSMETIIDAIKHKYQTEGLDPADLQFQVFFNDQVANDFNTLFASLPVDRCYFVAGVPGSFYGPLFPTSSICLSYSSSSIHWLSKVPKELVDKNSPAWNKGKIHYTGAKDDVVGAYAAQFDEDMNNFLNLRGKEIVKGGMIVIIVPGVPDGTTTHEIGIAFSFLESILIDLVKEGLIEQDEVDSFNIPHVYPSVEQMSRIVEKNGSFSIVKMELRNARLDPKAPIDYEGAVMNLRAVAEGTFANHFRSNNTVEEIFRRAIQQKSKLRHMLDSSGMEPGARLFAILMRK